MVLGYIARKSRQGLAAFLRGNTAKVYDALHLADNAGVYYAGKAADGFVADGGSKIFLTNNTELAAIQEARFAARS